MTLIHAAAMGEPAFRLLQAGGQVHVTGVTTKGVFLQNDQEQVLFLSFEDWRGPLTINLAPMAPGEGKQPATPSRYLKSSPPFDRLQVGCPGKMAPNEIALPAANIRIAIDCLTPWRTEVPAATFLDWTAILERLQRVTRLVGTAGTGRGWSVLLSRLDADARDEMLSPELTSAWQALMRLKQAFQVGDALGIATSAGNILGRGGGLTPSGDDVLVGVLLGWRFARIGQEDAVANYARQIVALAYQKTTALSAHLLACASDGQADERITTALLAVLGGGMPAAECARRLLSYGGSSGGDTLLGMSLALSLHE